MIAAALAGAGTPEGSEASEKCAAVKNWRFGYHKQIVKLARVGCYSPEAALGTETYKTPFNLEEMPPSFTTFDLSFVRRKHLGF